MQLRELLHLSSRTFSLGIDRLPGALREAVMIAYLLLRVSDYLEDNLEMPPRQKAELLRLWNSVLIGETPIHHFIGEMGFKGELSPDAIVAQNADQILHALRALPTPVQDILVRHVGDSTMGMARWTIRGPVVRTEAEMDDYMHEVAGRVGYLLTQLFALSSRTIRSKVQTMMPVARQFGLALQTVNIIRGLREDFERGWIFVPESFCERVNLAREALFEPENQGQAMEVVGMLADKAEGHLVAARNYMRHLPRRRYAIRMFCLFPLLFAERTLAVNRYDVGVLTGEVKISRGDVGQIVSDALRWGWSNRWIDRYSNQLAITGVS